MIRRGRGLARRALSNLLALEEYKVPEGARLQKKYCAEERHAHQMRVEVALLPVHSLHARATLQAEPEHEDGEDDGGQAGQHEQHIVDGEDPARKQLVLAREVEDTR